MLELKISYLENEEPGLITLDAVSFHFNILKQGISNNVHWRIALKMLVNGQT